MSDWKEVKILKKFGDTKMKVGDVLKVDFDSPANIDYLKNGYIKLIKKEVKITKTIPSQPTDTSEVSELGEISEVSEIPQPTSPATCVKDFLYVFSETMEDKLLKHFLTTENKPISVAKLSEVINENKKSIRTAINRNREYFNDSGVKGKAGVIFVTQVGVGCVQSRINEIIRNKDKKKEFKKKELEKKLTEENYEISITNFIQETKPNRDGLLIKLDFNILKEHDPALSDNLLEKPERFMMSFLRNYEKHTEVTISNLPDDSAISIEDIREKHLDKMICVDGRITSFGEVKPITTKIRFECPSCGTIIVVDQNYRIGNMREPSRCSCGRKGTFQILEEIKQNSCFLQLEDLQEKTDNPHSQRVKSVIFNGLTESKNIKIFNPGNEVRVIGILKDVPIFKNNKKTVFHNWILEIKSAELIEKDIDIDAFSKELVEDIQMLSNTISEKGLGILVESFAPEIYGYDKIKIALILQLANRRNNPRAKTMRHKANILLIGDPGVAKSVMCDFAVDVASGARKAVGGGSSAVGITASVVKEEDSLGGYRVEPGAMILAKDLLFIDEMNNLTDDDKPRLQEGMNEQRVSIDKANLHVKMPVTCGILAAANPKYGHFKETVLNMVHTEFNIPTPILNRFDTIFVLRDKVNEEIDKKIAEKMIKRHKGTLTNKYDREFLKKFFAYIKLSEEPEIDDEMEEYLKQIYSDARAGARGNVCINARFLESLNRMAIASAKLRQSKKIEKKDIDMSLSILAESQYSK